MIIDKNNIEKKFKEITVLDHELFAELLKKDSSISNFLLNNDKTGILLYPIPVDIKTSPLIQRFDNINDIDPQSIYIFDPLEKKYCEMSALLVHVSIRKIKNIATICGYLGAKKVEIIQMTYSTYNQNFNFSLDSNTQISTKANINTKGSYVSSIVENINQKISLREKFIGKRNIGKAITTAKLSGLYNDPIIKDLLENYEFKKSMEINVDLFSEVKKTVKSSATIKLGLDFIQSYLNAYTDLVKEINQTKGLTYKIYVEF